MHNTNNLYTVTFFKYFYQIEIILRLSFCLEDGILIGINAPSQGGPESKEQRKSTPHLPKLQN